MYTKLWTQFETQSLAFSILRKQLFPKYLVRGDFGEIRIYSPTADQKNPILLLTVKVQASISTEDQLFEKIDDKTVLLKGGGLAYKVQDLVKPYLPT